MALEEEEYPHELMLDFMKTDYSFQGSITMYVVCVVVTASVGGGLPRLKSVARVEGSS